MEEDIVGGVTVEALQSAVAELTDALAYERAKCQVLAEQLVAAEDERVKQDMESFGDVIGEEDKDVWADSLVANREKAIAALTRIRNRSKAAAPAAPVVAPSPDAAPPAAAAVAKVAPEASAVAAPRPLHNRAAVRVPGVAEEAAVPGGSVKSRVSRIANRARELNGVRGMSFDAAWRQAENEISE